MDAALWKAIAALPREEQMQLVEAIWDGLVANDDVPEITPAQRVELDRRLEGLDRDPGASLSWDEVRARIARR